MPEAQKTTLDLKLADADRESLGSLPIRIVASDFAISIYPHGHGDFDSVDGEGSPLFLEFYRGCLRVVVFPDINKEDAKVIDLSGAREDRRRHPEDLHDWTPLQKGRRFHEFLKQTNPVTGKPFTIREAAAALDVPYGTFRNLEALWRPVEDTRLNDEGRTEA